MARPRELSGDEVVAWKALRLRLCTDRPWLLSALYRATPVAVEHAPGGGDPGASGAGGADEVASADRWGRVYLDFGVESRLGMAAMAESVEEALGSWLRHGGVERDHHVERSDPRFEAVATAEVERVARAVASGVCALAHRRFDPDPAQGWREWAQRLAGPPQVSWQQRLAAVLRAAVANRAGTVDYTYARPGRRRVAGVVTPAMRAPSVRVAVVADVSPSIAADLGSVAAEVDRIARTAGLDASALTVVAVDREVLASGPWRSRGAALAMRSEGDSGTDMRVGIAAAVALRPRPDVVIVLTDGETPWPEARPPLPVIVALIGPGAVRRRSRALVPAWAVAVEISTADHDDED